MKSIEKINICLSHKPSSLLHLAEMQLGDQQYKVELWTLHRTLQLNKQIDGLGGATQDNSRRILG